MTDKEILLDVVHVLYELVNQLREIDYDHFAMDLDDIAHDISNTIRNEYGNQSTPR